MINDRDLKTGTLELPGDRMGQSPNNHAFANQFTSSFSRTFAQLTDFLTEKDFTELLVEALAMNHLSPNKEPSLKEIKRSIHQVETRALITPHKVDELFKHLEIVMIDHDRTDLAALCKDYEESSARFRQVRSSLIEASHTEGPDSINDARIKSTLRNIFTTEDEFYTSAHETFSRRNMIYQRLIQIVDKVLNQEPQNKDDIATFRDLLVQKMSEDLPNRGLFLGAVI